MGFYLPNGIGISCGAKRHHLHAVVRRSVAPGVFDEVTLAIDNTGSLSRVGGLGITDELPALSMLATSTMKKTLLGSSTLRHMLSRSPASWAAPS